MARRAVDDGRPDDVIWKGGKLYFKKRYPAEVRKARPDLKAFFEKSLRTGDIQTCKPRAAACLVEFEATCREALAPRKAETAEEWLRSLTPEKRDQLLAIANARDARDGSRFGPVEDAEEALARLSWDFTQSAMAAANPAPLSKLASAMLDTDAQARIREAVRAEIHRTTAPDGLALAALGYPETELPQSVRQAVTALTEASKAKTLSDALTIRIQDMGGGRYPSQIAWAVRLFHGVVGEKPLVDLRAADLTEFESAMRRMPTSTTVRNNILNGKISVREALDAAKDGEGMLTLQAIKKHVSFIRALSKLAFGKGLGGDKTDPFGSFIATREKKVRQRKHFIVSELESLFAEMEKSWLTDHRERVWICLLALFHGARREEICQLLKADIREFNGVWCMNVTTMADDDDAEDAEEIKRLKTDNAIRVIPIHHRLIDAGFLDFVKASTGPRLFGSLTRDADGRYGGKFGMQFGELRRRAGITVRRIRTFHGFRHTAITAMREAEWPYGMQLGLSGHGGVGSENDRYGTAASAKVSKPWVDKLTYDVAALDTVLKALASTPPVE